MKTNLLLSVYLRQIGLLQSKPVDRPKWRSSRWS